MTPSALRGKVGRRHHRPKAVPDPRNGAPCQHAINEVDSAGMI